MEKENFTDNAVQKQTKTNTNLYLALCVFEIAICILGSTGNILTCFTVIRSKTLHNATYLFVLSLSLADFLITSVLVPVRAAEHLSIYRRTNPPERTLLQVAVFIGRATILASLSSLAALSIDRYLALRYPLKYRASIRYNFTQIFLVIASLWILSLVFTSIPLMSGVTPLQGLLIFVLLVFVMTFIMITSSWQVFRLLKQLSLRLQHFKLAVSPNPSNQFSRRDKTTCCYIELESSPKATRPRSNGMPFDMNFENKAFHLERDSHPVRLLTVKPFKHPVHLSVVLEDGLTRTTSCDSPSPEFKRSTPLINNSKYVKPLFNGTVVTPSYETSQQTVGTAVINKNSLNDQQHTNQPSQKSKITKSNKISQLVNSATNYTSHNIGPEITKRKQLSLQFNSSSVTPHNSVGSTIGRHLADGYIAKTIVIIIGTFVLCIYPRIILIIYHLNYPETPQTAICRLWLKVLLYMNSVINPVLYAWRFRDFRQVFLALILSFKKKICCM